MTFRKRHPLALSLAIALQGAAFCANAGSLVDESKLPPLPHFQAGDVDAGKPICSDLNAYANSRWLAANPVPSDKTTWGSFEMLGERSLAAQKQIVEAAAASKSAAGSNEQKIGDIFALGMNEARLNAEGIAPIQPTLSRIDALKSGADIVQFLMDGFAQGDQQVFAFGPGEDFKNPQMVIGFAFQGGLSLPEKSYYSDAAQQPKRDAFVAHVERMFTLAGADPATAKAQAKTVLAFETRLAAASLARVELRDPNNQYHYVSVAEAEAITPHFSWSKLFAAEGLTGVQGFSIGQPKFFAEVDKMLSEVAVADWQAYLRYHAIADASPFLSDALSEARFDFYGRTMRGQKEQKPRWKRVLDTINGSMGEALGQVYVSEVFPESSKQQMQELVGNLREALKARLEKLEWMSAETKAKAMEKWNTFDPKIGYPDQWRDYAGLRIDRGQSYYANALAAGAFENAFQMAKIGKPADRKEWGMTPQTVNAYYNPLKNEIVFPAAILQPPFFDPGADPAVNYGGIGAVIGHEMLHGYDDQGSQFDATGKQQNWWTEEDLAKFKARTNQLKAQFDDYVHVNDPKEGALHVNGELTMGENIADLGGLTVAYDALQRDLMNKRMGEIDGYSQDQRFFLNWATVWRRNYTTEEAKVRLKTDSHAPAPFRAIGAPSNMAAFANAFECKAGDAMVRGDKNILIW